MNYETAHWLLELCSEKYLSTRHIALQVSVKSLLVGLTDSLFHDSNL